MAGFVGICIEDTFGENVLLPEQLYRASTFEAVVAAVVDRRET
jgi:hypothetical protein